MMTTTMLSFLVFLKLIVSQDVLQLLVILLALLHVLLHLSLLGIRHLRTLKTLLLGSTRLSIRAGTTRTSAHTRATKYILVFLVQSQHLGLLVGSEVQFLSHTLHHLFVCKLLRSLTLLVVVLCHH